MQRTKIFLCVPFSFSPRLEGKRVNLDSVFPSMLESTMTDPRLALRISMLEASGVSFHHFPPLPPGGSAVLYFRPPNAPEHRSQHSNLDAKPTHHQIR